MYLEIQAYEDLLTREGRQDMCKGKEWNVKKRSDK